MLAVRDASWAASGTTGDAATDRDSGAVAGETTAVERCVFGLASGGPGAGGETPVSSRPHEAARLPNRNGRATTTSLIPVGVVCMFLIPPATRLGSRPMCLAGPRAAAKVPIPNVAGRDSSFRHSRALPVLRTASDPERSDLRCPLDAAKRWVVRSHDDLTRA